MTPSVAIAVLGATLTVAVATALGGGKATNAAHGKQLYMTTGCYQCHGTSGEGGGNAGPRLAPQPIPFEALLLQLRHPRARMPVYTAVVMPDTDVADIHAFLQSVPKGKTAEEIALLKGLSASDPAAK
jgi:mono/diheme cytochrome c family protein